MKIILIDEDGKKLGEYELIEMTLRTKPEQEEQVKICYGESVYVETGTWI